MGIMFFFFFFFFLTIVFSCNIIGFIGLSFFYLFFSFVYFGCRCSCVYCSSNSSECEKGIMYFSFIFN